MPRKRKSKLSPYIVFPIAFLIGFPIGYFGSKLISLSLLPVEYALTGLTFIQVIVGIFSGLMFGTYFLIQLKKERQGY